MNKIKGYLLKLRNICFAQNLHFTNSSQAASYHRVVSHFLQTVRNSDIHIGLVMDIFPS